MGVNNKGYKYYIIFKGNDSKGWARFDRLFKTEKEYQKEIEAIEREGYGNTILSSGKLLDYIVHLAWDEEKEEE